MMPNIGILNNVHYVNGRTGLELQYQWIITEILEKPVAGENQIVATVQCKIYCVCSKA